MQKIVADLHFHSKFSRATSAEMTLENLRLWAKYKGVNLLGTADFTHPFWFSALKKNLAEAGSGLYQLKGESDEIKFVLSTEISCIYAEFGKVRRIHLVFLMPNFAAVEKFNERLTNIGNLYSDGRPILGISAYNLAKIALECDQRAIIIPAHIWTPWFSVLGSKSGYDSIKECFRDLTSRILAVETGLSSDPAMNWRVSDLDNFALVSNGDGHSLGNIAREANIFYLKKGEALTYDLLRKMLKEGSANFREHGFNENNSHFAYTIEFYPEEGKYHWSGHRACGYKTDHKNKSKINPETNSGQKSKVADENLCPKCGRPMTLGVIYRVDELADRPVGGKPENPASYKSLVQLSQIIAESFRVGENTLTVKNEYTRLIREFGSELAILEDVSPSDLKNQTNERIIEGIMRVRKGDIFIDPGYDGEFGKVKVFKDGDREKSAQKSLF
ncbi:MAG: UvrD/REP helicase [Candidatus Berkelbacteria bacterium Licking1014_7]|uniref:UvrD/REP helicase n=1 Tax=Candidatus Berkelbacteria bacterium Licking1014_7 TaxID=2017147 RepID=A0A554LJL2_9BACT|nr:MAG: UvrD/REP helicase [Candidatus Berkelbacteria bacterium Licking1014_7]